MYHPRFLVSPLVVILMCRVRPRGKTGANPRTNPQMQQKTRREVHLPRHVKRTTAYQCVVHPEFSPTTSGAESACCLLLDLHPNVDASHLGGPIAGVSDSPRQVCTAPNPLQRPVEYISPIGHFPRRQLLRPEKSRLVNNFAASTAVINCTVSGTS